MHSVEIQGKERTNCLQVNGDKMIYQVRVGTAGSSQESVYHVTASDIDMADMLAVKQYRQVDTEHITYISTSVERE